MISLKKILRKSIAGQQKYQEMLYERFCEMIMGICRRYSNHQNQAEDLFQECFIRVFKNLKSVKEAEALPGWIKRTAINTCLNQLKKEISFLSPIENVAADDNMYSDLLDKLSSEKIVEVINTLPTGYRTVINMYVVDGYSHKEISETLKISESTSRSQLTYAKKVLKEKLKNAGISRYESVI